MISSDGVSSVNNTLQHNVNSTHTSIVPVTSDVHDHHHHLQLDIVDHDHYNNTQVN